MPSERETIELILSTTSSFIHDISTPLAALQLKAEVLKSKISQLQKLNQQDSQNEEILTLLQNLQESINTDIHKIQQQTISLSNAIGTQKTAANRQSNASLFQTQALRVLIVEDEELHQQIALKVLEQCRKVDVAETGAKAIQRVKLERYDVILLDYFMPDTHAVELTQKIVEESLGSPKIIALTNYPRDINEKEISEVIVGQLTKPLRLQELITVLNQAEGN